MVLDVFTAGLSRSNSCAPCSPIDLFRECEAYARRKLALNKLHTGESYGEDYLALLTADTIRERAFSRYTVKRYELEAAL